MVHVYESEQFLNTDSETAWKFFSSASNLSKITPPEMNFRILTTLDGKEIYEGMLINYLVSPLFNISLKWQTIISKVSKPSLFVDNQVRGPYALWEHTHIFVEQEGGILMKDIVRYQLPFGFLGNLIHTLLVKKKIEHIFTYRRNTLEKLFNTKVE